MFIIHISLILFNIFQLLISAIIVLLSSVSVLRNLTKKPKIEQKSIKLEDEIYRINSTNFNNTR